ncbi:hypothetical protein AB0J74_31565 [Asanoa sp. NPDC049573]|uniref:hypothetical protein n=1 Tax=Asanoa sp. NPDC049573 TaxID=3155396 RepID=UPI0034428C8E
MGLGLGYVLAIACNQPVQATQPVRLRPDDIAAGLGDLASERRLRGAGFKGERFYYWAWVHDHSSDDGGVTQPAGPPRRRRRTGLPPLDPAPSTDGHSYRCGWSAVEQ